MFVSISKWWDVGMLSYLLTYLFIYLFIVMSEPDSSCLSLGNNLWIIGKKKKRILKMG